MARFYPAPVHTLLIGAAVVGAGIGTRSSTLAAQAPAGDFRADYVVEVKDTAEHLFHVTATFSGIDQPSLDLALPVWTPGWYTLEYYAKNVRLFTVTGENGDTIRAPLVQPQTWRIDIEGRDRIVVEFDYVADVLGINQAKLTETFAFFTGTQLFLEPVGHRNAASTVRFETPPDWPVATALMETSDPDVFTASDYDALVDAPTWLGAFQLHEFEVLGKPHYLVFPVGTQFSADSMAGYTDRFRTQIRTAAAIFGGLPYDKFMVFEIPGLVDDAKYGSGALEHANSYVECCGPPWLGGGNVHEFFHVWNVKRIRPAGMWPYDYSGPNLTPSLWFSEGVTSYYSRKINYRAGRASRENMLRTLNMGVLESNPERHLASLSDASVATWRDYLRGGPRNYYVGGAIMGALLDLSVLHDTDGRKGMDDVMRALYERYYQNGRGFTPEDLVSTVSSIAGRDYSDFFVAGNGK